MASTEVDHLVKMANQLADNFAYVSEPVHQAERIADHLRRFWAPSMRTRLIDYGEQGGSERLSPMVRRALSLIKSD